MLSKRWLINYVLLILIIIFTWIGMNNPITEDQLIDRDAITTLKAKNIETIRIESADGSIELEKKGNRWFVGSPVVWFADNIAAERIASLVGQKSHSQLPKNEIDLSTLGLTIPKAVVTLNQKSVYFGTTNQIGSRRYLMVDPNVYLVDDIHFAFINQGLSGVVDKRLLPSGSGLSGLQFSDFNISRQQGSWISDKQLQDNQAIEQLIKHWQTKEASKVQQYDRSLTPLQKIIASFEQQQSSEFYVLSIQPEIIIARPDMKLQFHFPDHQYYELLSLDKAPG